MKFIKTVQIVLQLLPALITAIKAIEQAIPGSGKGEQKLAAVRATLETVNEATGDLEQPFEEVWKILSKVVGIFVATLNTAGWRDDSAAA